MPRTEPYHFVVVCPNAAGVFLLGEFNGWSTTATPTRRTEQDVWQIDLDLPGGQWTNVTAQDAPRSATPSY